MYLASLNDFYTFLLDMLLPPRPAYAALTVAAAIFVAWFGPREARDRRHLISAADLSGGAALC